MRKSMRNIKCSSFRLFWEAGFEERGCSLGSAGLFEQSLPLSSRHCIHMSRNNQHLPPEQFRPEQHHVTLPATNSIHISTEALRGTDDQLTILSWARGYNERAVMCFSRRQYLLNNLHSVNTKGCLCVSQYILWFYNALVLIQL